jgi:hypothetical protein
VFGPLGGPNAPSRAAPLQPTAPPAAAAAAAPSTQSSTTTVTMVNDSIALVARLIESLEKTMAGNLATQSGGTWRQELNALSGSVQAAVVSAAAAGDAQPGAPGAAS